MPALFCNHYHHLRQCSKLAVCIYGTILLLTRKKADGEDPSPPGLYKAPIWRLVELLDENGGELAKLRRKLRNDKCRQYHVALKQLVDGKWLVKVAVRPGGPKHYFARTHKEWVELYGTEHCMMARSFSTHPDASETTDPDVA